MRPRTASFSINCFRQMAETRCFFYLAHHCSEEHSWHFCCRLDVQGAPAVPCPNTCLGWGFLPPLLVSLPRLSGAARGWWRSGSWPLGFKQSRTCHMRVFPSPSFLPHSTVPLCPSHTRMNKVMKEATGGLGTTWPWVLPSATTEVVTSYTTWIQFTKRCLWPSRRQRGLMKRRHFCHQFLSCTSPWDHDMAEQVFWFMSSQNQKRNLSKCE